MTASSLSRDRRRHLRVPCEKSVKLRCGVTGKYLAGESVDLSDGGCLLRLDAHVRVEPGRPVRVGIAHRRTAGLIRADDMIEGTIVRRLGHGGMQHVAVSFQNVSALAAAG
jgi:c-di-GMP-binding flagellar brake protein YcgR